jgi:hypothetical protein
MAPINYEICGIVQIINNFGDIIASEQTSRKRCQNRNIIDIPSEVPWPVGPPPALKKLRGTHFQHLEDKVVGEFVPWDGGIFNNVSHMALVKSVLYFLKRSTILPPSTSQLIFCEHYKTYYSFPLGGYVQTFQW